MHITIVGGGISGLSLAYFLLEKDPSLKLQVLEASEKPGGKIWTDKTDGFLCESGVNGFLNSKPRTLELSNRLSVDPLPSNDAARRRYIYSGRRLHQLPESPQAFIFSGLLSMRGRMRVFFEFFAGRGRDEDETLASFARRHLGKEAANKLIDPMASGIYAGNPEKLSLRSCFPRIHQLETRFGSLMRAMMILQVEALVTGKKIGPGPSGTLTSYYDGMGAIIKSLKDFLGARLFTSLAVEAIDKDNGRYQIALKDGHLFKSDIVVLACPAYEAARILNKYDRHLSSDISGIPYPSVSVVCLGYRKKSIRLNIDGFGFLVPGIEKRSILGTLWDSSIFPNRAPKGYALLRTMIGGARASEMAMKNDDELLNTLRGELRDIMNIKASPDFVRIYRHERAIPQYNVGHYRRLTDINSSLRRHDGLYLTGNAYKGIGYNDCIENSYRLAEQITNNG